VIGFGISIVETSFFIIRNLCSSDLYTAGILASLTLQLDSVALSVSHIQASAMNDFINLFVTFFP
jgi:hypothetical protein